MENVIKIECPEELLIGLHLDAEQFAGLMKQGIRYNAELVEKICKKLDE